MASSAKITKNRRGRRDEKKLKRRRKKVERKLRDEQANGVKF